MNKYDDLTFTYHITNEQSLYIIRDVIDGLIESLPQEERAIAEDIIYGESIKAICNKYKKTRTFVKRIQTKLQKLYKTNKY